MFSITENNKHIHWHTHVYTLRSPRNAKAMITIVSTVVHQHTPTLCTMRILLPIDCLVRSWSANATDLHIYGHHINIFNDWWTFIDDSVSLAKFNYNSHRTCAAYARQWMESIHSIVFAMAICNIELHDNACVIHFERSDSQRDTHKSTWLLERTK